MTPRKAPEDKLRPGRKPLPPEDRRSPAGYVRLRAEDLERLDRVAGPGGRQAFMTEAVLRAIKAGERKIAKS